MTNNPLFDTLTDEQKQQYLGWTTFKQSKSKVLTELKKRQEQSGYSCDMIIIDDVVNESLPFRTPKQKEYLQLLTDDYKSLLNSQLISTFRISGNEAKTANTAELQSKLVAKKLDEELYEKIGIRHANSEQELQKMWGRNY